MPLLARLDWLMDQVAASGRELHVAASSAQAQDTLKFRITIRDEPGAAMSAFVRAGLVAQQNLIRDLAVTHVAVDRGHRHSRGRSEVCFWIGPRRHTALAAKAAANMPDVPVRAPTTLLQQPAEAGTEIATEPDIEETHQNEEKQEAEEKQAGEGNKEEEEEDEEEGGPHEDSEKDQGMLDEELVDDSEGESSGSDTEPADEQQASQEEEEEEDDDSENEADTEAEDEEEAYEEEERAAVTSMVNAGLARAAVRETQQRCAGHGARRCDGCGQNAIGRRGTGRWMSRWYCNNCWQRW